MSTDYSDSDFKIKWVKVASMQSDRQFLVETFQGRRISGPLKVDRRRRRPCRSPRPSAARRDSAVQPFERSFLSRFDAGFDLGYSMTQANSAKQLSVGRQPRVPGQEASTPVRQHVQELAVEGSDTNRWDIGNDFRRLIGERWYADTSQDFLNSDEQALDLRTTIGGGGGRYLLRSVLSAPRGRRWAGMDERRLHGSVGGDEGLG